MACHPYEDFMAKYVHKSYLNQQNVEIINRKTFSDTHTQSKRINKEMAFSFGQF